MCYITYLYQGSCRILYPWLYSHTYAHYNVNTMCAAHCAVIYIYIFIYIYIYTRHGDDLVKKSNGPPREELRGQGNIPLDTHSSILYIILAIHTGAHAVLRDAHVCIRLRRIDVI